MIKRDDLRPLSMVDLMKARAENVQTHGIDWNDWLSSGTDTEAQKRTELLHFYDRAVQVAEAYENATNARERYRAMSELCRLSDRIGTACVQQGDKVYLASCELDGDYRIPHLVVVDTPPTRTYITNKELETLFGKSEISDKSGSMPITTYFDEVRTLLVEQRARGIKPQ